MRIRFFSIVIFAGLAAGFSLAQEPSPPTGLWKGSGLQKNPSASWAMEVDFGDGTGEARVSYPSLRCSGRLVPEKTGLYREVIDTGIAQCLEVGRYYLLQISAGQLLLHYESLSPRAPNASARATLSRPSTGDAPTAAAPCNDPDIVDSFSPTDERFHIYTVQAEVCRKESAGCSAQAVFEAMLRDKRRVAPTRETTPVVSCGTSRLWIPFLDYTEPSTIRTLVEPDKMRVVNYTLPNHSLHPGRVVRLIVERDETIDVLTYGEGTGILPLANRWLAPMVWGEVNGHLREAVAPK